MGREIAFKNIIHSAATLEITSFIVKATEKGKHWTVVVAKSI